MRQALKLVLVATTFAIHTLAVKAQEHPFQLIREGRIDAALLIWPAESDELSEALRDLTQEALVEDRVEDGLVHASTWFESVFRRGPAPGIARDLVDFLTVYVNLLERVPHSAAAPVAVPDRVRQAFAELAGLIGRHRDSATESNFRKVLRACERVVEASPSNPLALVAAMAAVEEPEGPYISSLVLESVDSMRDRLVRSGVPVDRLLASMAGYCDRISESELDDELAIRGAKLWEEVANGAERAADKCQFLSLARRAASRGEDDVLQDRLTKRILGEYPRSREAREIVDRITSSEIVDATPDEGMMFLRRFEKKHDVDVSSALFALSKRFYAARNYRKAIELLEEILERFPDSPRASLATLGLGETFQKLGKTELAKRAWERAARMKAVNTSQAVMDASNTASRAGAALVALAERESDGEYALRPWLDAPTGSWCGTCANSLRDERDAAIRKALQNLRLRPEFAQLLESIVVEGRGHHSSIAENLVDATPIRDRIVLVGRCTKIAEMDATNLLARDVVLVLGIRRRSAAGDLKSLWRMLAWWPDHVGYQTRDPDLPPLLPGADERVMNALQSLREGRRFLSEKLRTSRSHELAWAAWRSTDFDAVEARLDAARDPLTLTRLCRVLVRIDRTRGLSRARQLAKHPVEWRREVGEIWDGER